MFGLLLLQVVFKQEVEDLAQYIVSFCEKQDAGTSASKRYRAVAKKGVCLIKRNIHRVVAYVPNAVF